MFHDVRLLLEASEDLSLGREFYEGQASGLGAYFIDSLLAEMESLKLYGGIHPKRFGYFRMLCRRFPYAVYYDVEGSDQILVVAILDMRRDPDIAKRRLQAD